MSSLNSLGFLPYQSENRMAQRLANFRVIKNSIAQICTAVEVQRETIRNTRAQQAQNPGQAQSLQPLILKAQQNITGLLATAQELEQRADVINLQIEALSTAVRNIQLQRNSAPSPRGGSPSGRRTPSPRGGSRGGSRA